jgi:hypothetical protein
MIGLPQTPHHFFDVGLTAVTALTTGASLRSDTTVPGLARTCLRRPRPTVGVHPLSSELCDHACVLPYAAYLRVYQPISAYPPRTRAYWLAYARSPHRPRRVHAVSAEHTESLRRAVATPARVAPSEESTHAYVRTWRSRIYVCPWQTRLRSWIAFRDFRKATPRGLLSAFLPSNSAAEAHAGLDDWAAQGEPSATQIVTSRWGIPVAWFTLFTDEERSLSLPEPTPQRSTCRPARHATGERGTAPPFSF